MIVVVDHIPGLAEALIPFDEVRSLPASAITNETLRAVGCTDLFVRTTTRVDERLLRNTAVRFVGTASSGSDHVDRAIADVLGITVCSAPGCNALAVTEYVLYAILRLHSRRDGKISEDSLQRHRIGIVGYGNVGRMVGRACGILDIPILINDPPAHEQGDLTEAEQRLHCGLDELLERCSIVTNHVPKTSVGEHPTLRLFDAQRLAKLGEDTIFIHSSRGGIVDEQALMIQKKRKHIRTAIDVWESEPVYSVYTARGSDISTPHIAGHSVDAHYTAAAMMYRSYLNRIVGVDAANIDEIPTCLRTGSPAHRMALSDVSDMNELLASLEQSLDIRRLHEHLTHPRNNHEDLGAHFLGARNSYTSRREIITLT